MGECIRRLLLLSCPVLVAGDFNAKSALWGSLRPDRRSEVFTEWAAELGLCIMNTGTRSTCVRPQGESIVDLTWADPSAACLIRDWRVVTDTESLSDHRYIEMVAAP